MYIVAITRWGRPFNEEIADLSKVTGIHPYDLRLRISGALPVVLAGFSDADKARLLMTTLKARTHGAVAIDINKVTEPDKVVMPKTFEFDNANIIVTDSTHGTETIAYDSILALIHAQQEIETRSTSVSKSRKFSAARAVITGGLVMTKKSTKETREIENAYEQIVYAFRKPCQLAFVLRQNRLLYSGLGSGIRHSSLENFSRLVALFREHAVEAYYDDRLLKRRSGANFMQVSMNHSAADTLKSRASVSITNAFETDLVAHLIAVAHYRGQL